MALLEIPIRNDLRAQFFSIDLEGVLFNLEFKFNLRQGLWYMDIKDAQKNDILTGVPLQTDVDLRSRFVQAGLPPGFLFMYDVLLEQKDADQDDVGERVRLLYEESTS